MAAHKMVHPRSAMALVSPIGIAKEICYGIIVAMAFGGAWKWKQWEGQRDRKLFYSQLEKGEISIVRED